LDKQHKGKNKMNAKERMELGNEPCPKCGFKLITVEELKRFI